ncbi:MAG: TonB-dependent receptor [Nannocystaceae bacterium]|nr:TonB-dependent receptor [Nannocystaceae bacterium]
MLATSTTKVLSAALWCAAAPPASRGAEADADPQSAEDGSRYRTVVRAPSRRGAAARSPGFVSVIPLDDPKSATPRDGLAEVLSRAPGVHVRSLGGLGQFGAVSIRGSAPQQVAIFLDGVPVSGSMAGLVDLADLPLDGISRLEVHRGWIPIAYGAAAMGGALDLVSTPSDAPAAVRAEAGAGSWWTRQAAAEIRGRTRRVGWAARASYAGSTGAFSYYDDRGTRLSGDDGLARRSGNGYDRVLAQLRLSARRGRWRIGAHQLAVGKRAGVPGPGSAQAQAAGNDQLMSRSIVRLRHDGGARPGTRLEWLAGVGVEARRFRDPRAELGVGRDDQRALTLDVYLSPRLRVPLWHQAWLGVVADGRGERIAIDQRVQRPDGSPTGDAVRSRAAIGAGIELEQFAWAGRLQLVPALRVDGVASRFAVPAGRGEQDDRGRNRSFVAVSPRLGLRVSVVPPLSLRGSIGRYFRAPTLVELFGDRGFFVGNEGLVPERGVVADGGATLEHDGRHGGVFGHLAGFWIRSRDLIQWIAAGTVARPENVAAARVRGFESALGVRAPDDRLEVSLNYTWLDAVDRSGDPGRDGHALPGRPRHDLFARAAFGWRFHPRGVAVEPRLVYTAELVARTFLDPSGRYVLPPRALQAVGLQAWIDARVLLGLEVRNLLDVRTATVVLPVGDRQPSPVAIADFIGYPLPGRSVWAHVRVEFELGGSRRKGRRRS